MTVLLTFTKTFIIILYAHPQMLIFMKTVIINDINTGKQGHRVGFTVYASCPLKDKANEVDCCLLSTRSIRTGSSHGNKVRQNIIFV